MNNLVSILIPAYNSEKWISETIRSATAQSWPNKEIIIVDDGSIDSTLEIARRFESPIVKVLTQENRGASAARNAALSSAQGEFVQWLDADDILHPEKILSQMNVAKSIEDQNILFSSSFGVFYNNIKKYRIVSNPLCKNHIPIDWILVKFLNTWMPPMTWLVSRQLTDSAGGWDERLSLDDDGEYFCRLVTMSNGIHYIPEALSYYRISGSHSLSRSNSIRSCESLLLSIELCINYLMMLENSPRTKEASIKYLQLWYHYFFPEKSNLVERSKELAEKLGGILESPKLTWKYAIIKNIGGWQAAKTVRSKVASVKLKTYMYLDRNLNLF